MLAEYLEIRVIHWIRRGYLGTSAILGEGDQSKDYNRAKLVLATKEG